MTRTTDMSMSTFLSKFEKGMAKPNKFRVEFNLPAGVNLQRGDIGVNEDALVSNIQAVNTILNQNGNIDVKCHTLNFPQRSLMTFEHKQNSAPMRMPYSSTYDPITFSFYADSDYDTRDFFDVWQSSVINFGTNTVNFYREYTSNIKMYAVNDMGKDTYGVVLEDAYPLNVGILDFSYSQFNNFQNVTVTMAYKKWTPLKYFQERSG